MTRQDTISKVILYDLPGPAGRKRIGKRTFGRSIERLVDIRVTVWSTLCEYAWFKARLS